MSVPEHAIADDQARLVLDRLHAEDAAERAAGLPTEERIRAATPATGAFLYAVTLALRPKLVFEMGSSHAYSTIWFALAARTYGGQVIGTEIRPERVARANANLAEAGLADWARVEAGDAAEIARQLNTPIDLVFIDAEKDDYSRLFLAVIDVVRPGGLILADNVISHDCRAYQDLLRSRSDVHTITLAVERGIEWTVKQW
ncbi:O-methyltransferase [Thermorudis peleae]|uniref:O-methyltransferase n=1 Tax=Thermorudis peleae TaxID=1382356 RepID=UPI000571F6F4|nr:class I SAM-dependent methyltransferase [Thermorudis peleae]MBX6753085.1 DUF1442 domain-containing protein [Thermorudis peleae]